MNNKTGFISAIFTGAMTILFAFSMIIGSLFISYLSSLFISWGFVILACSFYIKANQEYKIFALIGIIFGCMYALTNDIVYFTQLTTVRNSVLSNDINNLLSYSNLGSWMFNIDLFGYALMSLPTFFTGLSINPIAKAEKWLKGLLLIHGVFALTCFVMPIINVFGKSADDSGNIIGTLVLTFWCINFTPICVLSALHFRTEKSK
jgi:hypothetical protein